MERVVSQSLRRELDKQESAEALVAFLTITHPLIDPPIRLVSDPEQFRLVAGGPLYTGFHFDCEILTDSATQFPTCRLIVANVDRLIGQTIRKLKDRPKVVLSIYPLSEFDETVIPRVPIATTPYVLYTTGEIYLSEVEVDDMITGTLTSKTYAQESWPYNRTIKRTFPALYK